MCSSVDQSVGKKKELLRSTSSKQAFQRLITLFLIFLKFHKRTDTVQLRTNAKS